MGSEGVIDANWTRRDVLRRAAYGLFGVSALAQLGSGEDAVAQGRPNILLIMADDLGSECLGCYGGTSYATPNLDALAAGGVRFERCYATPLCTPSRVQLMTGRYGFRNYKRFGFLDPAERTFGHILRERGYRTAVAGKWQLGGSLEDDVARTYGFDEYCLWQFSVAGNKKGDRYGNPVLDQDGRRLEATAGRYGPDVVSDFLVDFMRRNRERPFLAYYPMILTHSPYVPTPDSPDWDPELAGERSPQRDRHFGEMLAYADKMVGKLVAAVEALGLRERTLILFTTDNGTARIASQTTRGPVAGAKGELTEAGCRVPMIAAGAGVSAPRVVSDLVDFTDVLPTLAELAGAPVPGDRVLDGRSFVPILADRPGGRREWAFCYYDPRHGKARPGAFACTARYKLYHDGRLFDLSVDPDERSPIAADAGGADAVAARRALVGVFDQMRQQGADFTFGR